jgi:hypothetical protein
MARKTFVIAALFLVAGAGAASANATFRQLAGQWHGGGTVDYTDGTRERLQCRAAYDVLRGASDVQLRIRCASASFNFDLTGSAREVNDRVSGEWSEASQNVGGTLSGTAQGNRVRVVATGAGMSAGLTVVTHGSRQTVSIRTQSPQSRFQGATVSLSR